MAKIYICPKCHSEYEEKEAKRNLLLCKKCKVKLKEKRAKEYMLDFGDFKVVFTLPVLIGRNHQPQFKENRYISREHCEIFEENSQIYIVDKSTNGTFVNGKKITAKSALKIGDRVKLANMEAAFKETK